MILLLTACQTQQPLVSEIKTETVQVPVPVKCVDKNALPQSKFVKDGTVDQNAAAASLELREWRKFGAVVAQECGTD